MRDDDPIEIDLTPAERRLLRHGLSEWGGSARCTDEIAVVIGFASSVDLMSERDRLVMAIEDGTALPPADWRRALISTEIVFASDLLGAGVDWSTTTGLSDGETIERLRDVQRKVLAVAIARAGG